ncbi:30S ribosomal protein S1 [candidate division WWE3 bacterium CG08_land_8_20_14_0_20_41_10]|uniref:30S ribosomal protein S1 n=1 Tax=candidate division WWE3 bacterium CG08_land_8_20_14_0_20_41_10 TaxID=1975085 RepID=A0A2H0XAJ0_UNCKA|nr:MAG: 30S ribosomal protein S1 [candidate division WWE3 bacterium CG08_land_8_20_14_0_20_41_10]
MSIRKLREACFRWTRCELYHTLNRYMKAKKVLKKESSMAKLMGNSPTLKKFMVGDVVEGSIVAIRENEILLDIGAKSEGVITREEFGEFKASLADLKPGDTLVAQVIQSESEQGYTVLSLKRAERERKWRDIEKMYSQGIDGEAQVIEYNKGGLLVEFMGMRGFVPLSHLDRVHFTNDVAKFAHGSEAEIRESLKVLSGKLLKIRVIEYDKEKNRLILSEKKALEHYSEEARTKRLGEVKEGDTVEGVVTGVMAFGVFVDLDGIEGLVHISEIAWEKVSNPSVYYTVGSKVTVKVMGVDKGSKRLALSIKRLTTNPWEGINNRFKVGQKVKGVVSKIVPFGAFINVEKGLDGLLHISQATGPLQVGQEVEARIIGIEPENQKLSLSLKEEQPAQV